MEGTEFTVDTDAVTGIGWTGGSDGIVSLAVADGITTGAAGALKGTIKNSSTSVNGAVVEWNRSVNGEWSCTIDKTAVSTKGWKDSFAPKGCPAS